MFSTASLGVVAETHVVEALREAGPKVCTKYNDREKMPDMCLKGLAYQRHRGKGWGRFCQAWYIFHLINFTASFDELPPGRVLRYLAARHIFCEVDLDVFANNRISSMLDSGLSLREISAQ
jgi:hypothetical protein